MDTSPKPQEQKAETKDDKKNPSLTPPAPEEIGGRGGLEPTRYGDWEHKGKCVDF